MARTITKPPQPQLLDTHTPMSHIYSYQQTTPPAVVTVATLAEARKLANKERRKVGRERHEERKEELKALEIDRECKRDGRDAAQRQEKRREDGTRAFTGRNTYNHRKAGALHVRATDIITTAAVAAGAEDGDHHHHHHHVEEEEENEENDEEAYYDTEEEEEVRFTEEQATSGAMLLAMARPAKTRTRRPPVMTDGEMFEVVEIDGRLVALDEDGWEILPDENAEVSLLYSDIVRGTAL